MENPTNRELAILIQANLEKNELQHKAILESLNTFHETTKETLERIVCQTTKTNGRVNALENWKSYMLGAIAIIGIVVPFIITYAMR